MLRVADLFSGIGGFSLGLQRAGGFQTVAFCESDRFCQRVLGKHWPDVPIFDDIRKLTGPMLGPIEVLTGGFPCQDISVAGSGAGLAGARSGLWSEFARLIGDARPRWVVIENTSALRTRGLDQVLRSLAALGFDAEWHCIPACALGAEHRRDRVWILAYPRGAGLSLSEQAPVFSARWWQEGRAIAERAGWAREPGLGRVVHGVPGRVDRLRALGNAAVPQIVELIGRAILAADQIQHSTMTGSSPSDRGMTVSPSDRK